MQDIVQLSADLKLDMSREAEIEFNKIYKVLDIIDANVSASKNNLNQTDPKNLSSAKKKVFTQLKTKIESLAKRLKTKRNNLNGQKSKIDNLLKGNLSIEDINCKYLVKMNEVNGILTSLHEIRNGDIAEISKLMGELHDR